MRGRRELSIAIVGAGIGGLATAAALRRLGIDSVVYEQADALARVDGPKPSRQRELPAQPVCKSSRLLPASSEALCPLLC